MYGHQYTEQERQFFVEYVPGHTYKEIQAKFIEKFGWEIKVSQIKGYMANHRINSGTKGHFKKGHVPINKGKKGVYAPGCEKTWFQKGHIPTNHRPVGSERVNVYGYVEIKVAEPNKWRLKHRVIWETYHGPIPKNCVLIFKDGNKLNTDIENLRLVEKSTHAVMNRSGLYKYSGEFKDTAIAMAELTRATHQKKKGGQRTCND